MILYEIEKVIDDIYLGNLENIETRIIDLLSKVMVEGVNDEIKFLDIVKVIDVEIKNKNFIYICDLLKFELIKLLNN